MRALLVVGSFAAVMWGCSSGGGGTDAGGLDGPERTVASSDNSAVLWIPAGSIKAGVAITVEPIDGGYAFSPSGLKFDKPAYLFHTPNVGGPARDAGYSWYAATLVGDDDTREPAVTHRVSVGGHEGEPVELGAVRIPHFSTLRFEEGDPMFGVIEQSLFGELFWRYEGDRWPTRVSLGRADMPADGWFDVRWSVFADGAVESVPLTPDVTREQTLDLRTMTGVTGDIDFRCKAAGKGLVGLRANRRFQFLSTLTRITRGTCNPREVVQAVDATKVGPTLTVEESTALAEAELAQVMTYEQPKITLQEAMEAAQKGRGARRPPGPPPGITTEWTLPCTEHCPLNTPFNATVKLTNTSASTIDLFAQFQGAGPGLQAYLSADEVPLGPGAFHTYTVKYTCESDCLRPLVGWLRLARIANDSLVKSPKIQCGKGGDALMLSDNTRLTKNGTGWTAAATGVTANVIQAATAVDSKFVSSSGGTLLFHGVTAFDSSAGVSPIRLRSSLQTGTATFNGSRYVVTGLVGSAAYAASDTLTVDHTPTDGGTPLSVMVNAPPRIADVNTLFGARAGLATPVQLADGTFDVMFVNVVGGPAGAPAGQNGVLRSVPAAQMQLVGGNRVAPLLDDEMISNLAELGWVATTVYVAAYREAETPLFFPGRPPVPVQAGRMFQVNVADLAP